MPDGVAPLLERLLPGRVTSIIVSRDGSGRRSEKSESWPINEISEINETIEASVAPPWARAFVTVHATMLRGGASCFGVR